MRAYPVFAAAVLITLALAGFNALMVALMAARLDSLLPGAFAQMGHFTEAQHRTHDLTFAFIFMPTVLGMLAQLRRPLTNVAGQLMAVIPPVALMVTVVLTLILDRNADALQPPWITVGVASLVATVLHPTWRDFFRSFSFARSNRVMLGLVIVATVPLLFLAATNINLQGTARDDHVQPGHYGFMAAASFTVIGLGFLASLRPDGWRLTAWVAGLLPLLLGLTSMVYPDATSSLSPLWSVAGLAWGFAFVAAAEVSRSIPVAERDTGGYAHG
jgi:hypothetical protein